MTQEPYDTGHPVEPLLVPPSYTNGLTWKIVAAVLGSIVLAVLFFLGSVVWTNTGRITNLENDVKYLHLQDAEMKARQDDLFKQLLDHRERTEWQWTPVPPKRTR